MSQKVNKTYGDLLVLVRGLNILASNKEIAESKVAKKLEKIGKKAQVQLEVYNEKLEDLRLDNAHTDESGSLILDEKGGYKFSKEGLKNLNKKIKELLDEKFEFYQLNFSAEGLEEFTFLHGWVEGVPAPVEELEVEEA